MNRAFRSLTAGLLALSFLGGVTLEPFGMHGCDHHSDLGSPGGAAEHAGHDMAMGAMDHGPDTHPASPTQGHDDHGGACHCLGDCGVSGPTTLAVLAGTTIHRAAPAAWIAALGVDDAQPGLTPVPHRLPFPNAPPARI